MVNESCIRTEDEKEDKSILPIRENDGLKRLLLKRDELRIGLQLSEQLNQLLRKLINKKLATVTDPTRDQSAAAANLTAEASCFQLESIVNEVVTFTAGSQDEDETQFFKISYGKSHTQSLGHRSLVCRGCKINFRFIKIRIGLNRICAYTEHCIKQCAKYKELGEFYNYICHFKLNLIKLLSYRYHQPLLQMQTVIP